MILITSKGFKQSILEKGDFEIKLNIFRIGLKKVFPEGTNDFPIPDLPGRI